MKNILSYQCGSVFTGKEIKEWIAYHLKNKTSHTRQANYLRRFFSLKDDKLYSLCKDDYSSCASYKQFMFINK